MCTIGKMRLARARYVTYVQLWLLCLFRKSKSQVHLNECLTGSLLFPVRLFVYLLFHRVPAAVNLGLFDSWDFQRRVFYVGR
jgi:hypothetical protein